jgi:ATP-dependent helicase HrpA
MNDSPNATSIDRLQQAIDQAFGPDRAGLRRRLSGLRRRRKGGQPIDRGAAALAAALEQSRVRVAERQAALPVPEYPPELPVSQRRDDLLAAIANHQVVIVCGATGSGKSTQLPKLCLELGRGVRGMIAHTQPRRIAARTLAARVAEELCTELGRQVGYKVRFTDQVGPQTHVKLLTDGMLLAEIQGDRLLEAYDTIIIDEAHERSLNIDFLLGYLKQILPRRPDLKVIVTSATIDPERFARHFDGAPVIEVSGRSYPVEVRYRPPLTEAGEERDQRAAILDAVDELAAEGPGDVLVFLTGEREIRETTEALRKHHPKNTEILPLYARLSAQEQQRVFSPGKLRRVVLATNVAETSVTVPGIRYVIDNGQARISRYSYRTKVQRLPIEPIAQANANQRAGRCGRLGPGVCVRLYSEQDFAARPEYGEPEIQRTNLAAVILQMKALRLGEVEDFPFIDPPDRRFVNDGYKLLHELGAVDGKRELTELGRRLARLPVDPRVGRILLQAGREGCVAEMLVIAAVLSIQDPRERPLEAQQAADQAQQPFRDERSDFVGHLNLWREYREEARRLSGRKLTEWCRARFLSPARMRDWVDIHRQLTELAASLELRPNEQPAEYPQIHRALLSGFLSNVATRGEGSEYVGARGIKLQIFPGSGVFKTRPKWIMAAELVETARLYARDVADVRPEWVEALASHLVSRSYMDPHWESRAGQVAAFENVSLYGLLLAARRKVNFGPVDPVLARELFIREGLVRGGLRTRGAFYQHNRRLISEIEGLEAKTRRRDVLVEEDALYAFYDQRIPAGVYSAASFERWREKAEQEQPKLLFMTRADIMQRGAGEVTAADFPSRFEVAGMALPLEYHFEPGHAFDGVTAVVPLAALNQLSPAPFDWLVPGLRHEKASALIKALPKALRRHFVPAPDFAQAVLQAATPGEGSLQEALRRELKRMTGVDVPIDAWDAVELPTHLVMHYRVIDENGRTVGSGSDLPALQRDLGERAAEQLGRAPVGGWERTDVRRWDFGDLPDTVEVKTHGVSIRAYPALVDKRDHVELRLLDAPADARSASRAGVRRLFMLEMAQQMKYLRRNLPHLEAMCLHFREVASCDALRDDLLAAAIDRAFMADGVLPRTEEDFRARLATGRGELVAIANALCERAREVLALYHEIRKRMKGAVVLTQLESLNDLKEQLGHLVYPGFVSETPEERFVHLPRYLQGALRRLQKLASDPGRDRSLLREIRPHWERYLARAEQHRQKQIDDPALSEFRWLLEEFRVSLFAQELKTAVPVSDKRLRQQWQQVV